MIENYILTAVSGVVTLLAGLITSHLSNSQKRENTIDRKKIEALLAASGETKSTLLKALSSKDPDSEITKKLGTAGDIVINQVIRGESQLIQELVENYHQQALAQARAQFWFSVAAATIGFGYILYSASTSGEGYSMLIKTLPGVIIDAVSVLFFTQAEQTRQRATELYDRLRKDNQAAMAKELLASIEDPLIRSVAQAQMGLHLAGVTTKDFDVAGFLSKPQSFIPPRES